MTPPALLFSRFLTACLLGVGLGIFYDLLSCLPKALRHLGDGIFVIGLFAFGIYLGFGVCGGDLRPIYSAGLFIGAIGWHYSLGRLFRRLILAFFRILAHLFSLIFKPFEKIFSIILLFFKKTFAIIKKSSTIG